MALHEHACSRCGDRECSPNVEAFEEFGQVVCDDCADALFAADELSDEGEDGECCPGCGACPGFTGIDCDETCDWATTGPGAP